jgi:hypothetical protein
MKGVYPRSRVLRLIGQDDIDNQCASTIVREYDKLGARTIGTNHIFAVANIRCSYKSGYGGRR